MRWQFPVRVCLRVLDAALASVLALSALPLLLAGRGHRSSDGPHGLFLVAGADMGAIYRKFGSFEPMLADNPGCFRQITRLVPGESVCDIKLNEAFFVVQRPTLGVAFPFLGHARLLWAAAILSLKNPIDLVHSRSPYHLGLIGLVVAKALGVPLCVSIHADYDKREKLQPGIIPRTLGSIGLTRKIQGVLYRHATRVLPIRESLVPGILETGCDPEKIRVFPHGVELGKPVASSCPDVRERYGLSKEARIVSFAGRLELENYSGQLMDICLKLIEARPDIHAVICGDGSQREAMLAAAQAAGVSGRMIFPGFVANEMVRAIRGQSSVNLALMGGFSLIEACASGRPVVAYDVEWHYELVRSGETGFLAPEGEVESIVEFALGVLDDETLARKVGEAARQLAHDKHDLGLVCKRKSEIYREIL